MRKISSRTIVIILIVLAIGGLAAVKIGKRIVKAYEEYDASLVKDRGDAPALHSDLWYNTQAPLDLASMRGRVVVVDFWRFQCPECVHALPHVIDLYNRYRPQGVDFVSVHSPETPAEYDLNLVQTFISQTGITYPVAIDTNHAIFDAYMARAWPTLVVIDRQGHIRYRHIGEGGYDDIEAAVKSVLADS